MAKKNLDIIIRIKDNFSRVLKKGQTRFQKFGASVKKSLAGVGIAFAGIGIAVGKAIGKFVTFEKEMTKVNTLIRKSKGEIKGMGDEVRQLSQEFGVGADEIAGGLFNIISAMGQTEDTMGVLSDVVKSSVAGFSDVRTMAEFTTKAINSLDLQAKDSTRVLNALFKALEVGAGTAEQYAAAVGIFLPTGKAVNQNIETQLGVFASLTTQMKSTERAATSLRGVFVELGRPRFAEVLQQFKEVADIKIIDPDTDTFRDFALIIDDLQKSLVGVSAQRGAEIMSNLFPSIEAKAALDVILGNYRAFTLRMTAMSSGLSKAMNDAFAQMADTTAFQIDRMQAKVDELQRQLGEDFAPSIEPGFKLLQKLLSGLLGTLESLVAPIQAVWGALEVPVGVIQAIATLGKETGVLKDGIANLGEAADKIRAGALGVAGAFVPKVGGFKELRQEIDGLLKLREEGKLSQLDEIRLTEMSIEVLEKYTQKWATGRKQQIDRLNDVLAKQREELQGLKDIEKEMATFQKTFLGASPGDVLTNIFEDLGKNKDDIAKAFGGIGFQILDETGKSLERSSPEFQKAVLEFLKKNYGDALAKAAEEVNMPVPGFDTADIDKEVDALITRVNEKLRTSLLQLRREGTGTADLLKEEKRVIDETLAILEKEYPGAQVQINNLLEQSLDLQDKITGKTKDTTSAIKDQITELNNAFDIRSKMARLKFGRDEVGLSLELLQIEKEREAAQRKANVPLNDRLDLMNKIQQMGFRIEDTAAAAQEKQNRANERAAKEAQARLKKQEDDQKKAWEDEQSRRKKAAADAERRAQKLHEDNIRRFEIEERLTVSNAIVTRNVAKGTKEETQLRIEAAETHLKQLAGMNDQLLQQSEIRIRINELQAELVERSKTAAEIADASLMASEKDLLMRAEIARLTGQPFEAVEANLQAAIKAFEEFKKRQREIQSPGDQAKEAQLRAGIMTAQRRKDAADAAKAAVNAAAAEFQAIQSGLASAIETGMKEGGQKGLVSFGEMLKNMFIKKVSEALASQILSGGITALFGGGVPGGEVGGLGAVAGLAGGGPSSGSSLITGAGQAAGGLGDSGLLGGENSGAASTASTIGNVISLVGAAYAVGSMLGVFGKKGDLPAQAAQMQIGQQTINAGGSGALSGSEAFNRASSSSRNAQGDMTRQFMSGRGGDKEIVILIKPSDGAEKFIDVSSVSQSITNGLAGMNIRTGHTT